MSQSVDPTARRALGQHGEDVAAQYLERLGFVVLQRNWRSGREGEIDIVAQDGDCIVIVEVKTRRTEYFGRAVEAVSFHKAARLRRLAARWMAAHHPSAARVRIDVVGVLIGADGTTSVEHIREVGSW